MIINMLFMPEFFSSLGRGNKKSKPYYKIEHGAIFFFIYSKHFMWIILLSFKKL